jgi:dolichyl-phosphate beta-glucosyltransferase
MRDLFLSLVVPVYNEEKRFAAPPEKAFEYLSANFSRWEIIYVDDGSKDQTYACLLEAQKTHPGLQIARNTTNSGKGSAIRKGMQAAAGEVILFSDADFSTPIEDSEKLLGVLLEGYDLAIASRDLPSSNVEVHQSEIREFMGKTFNLIIRSLLPLDFQDTQCGFKMFRKRAAEIILPRMQLDGFAFDVEMLVIAQANSLKIAEVPVTWRNVLESRVHPIRNSLEMLRDVLSIRYRLATSQL